jgi:hypothetical protein
MKNQEDKSKINWDSLLNFLPTSSCKYLIEIKIKIIFNKLLKINLIFEISIF